MKLAFAIPARLSPSEAADLARQALQAGFNAVELPFTDPDAVTSGATHASCEAMIAAVRDADTPVAALDLTGSRAGDLCSSDADDRRTARETILAGLDLACRLGASTLSISPDVGLDRAAPGRVASYEDACHHCLESCLALRFDAERHGVRIGIAPCRDRFLTSPIEVRALIDAINSPWFGACLDANATRACGRLTDWITTLGWRLSGLSLDDSADPSRGDEQNASPPAQNPDALTITTALADTAYAGPIIWRTGRLDLAKNRLLQFLDSSC